MLRGMGGQDASPVSPLKGCHRTCKRLLVGNLGLAFRNEALLLVNASLDRPLLPPDGSLWERALVRVVCAALLSFLPRSASARLGKGRFVLLVIPETLSSSVCHSFRGKQHSAWVFLDSLPSSLISTQGRDKGRSWLQLISAEGGFCGKEIFFSLSVIIKHYRFPFLEECNSEGAGLPSDIHRCVWHPALP